MEWWVACKLTIELVVGEVSSYMKKLMRAGVVEQTVADGFVISIAGWLLLM